VNEPPQFYAWVTLIVLSMLSGTFSGLNLGLMSLTEDDLNVIIDGSTDPKEVKWAKKILPLRKKGNLLLCTLLIGNTLVNVMLTIITDPIWTFLFGGLGGFVTQLMVIAVPTTIIVIFGEICPQAYCGRNSLFVGAVSTPLVWVFVFLTYPVTKPIAVVLDKLLGREISCVLSRTMLLELVTLNVESSDHAKKSGLTQEDGRLLKGALTFKDRTVGDVMTPLSTCYFLEESTLLTHATIMDILGHGHTRVPVYSGTQSNVVAILFCKDLLGIGFERAQPLREVLASFGAERRVVRVPRAMTLNLAMDYCKRKRTHLLLICDDAHTEGGDAKVAKADAPVVGLATMEDFLEELIQDEIVDETDVWHYDRQDSTLPDGKKKAASPVNKVVVQAKGVDLTAHLRKLAPVVEPQRLPPTQSTPSTSAVVAAAAAPATALQA